MQFRPPQTQATTATARPPQTQATTATALIIIIIIELPRAAELCRKAKIKNLKIFEKVLKKLLTSALKYAIMYTQDKTRAGTLRKR